MPESSNTQDAYQVARTSSGRWKVLNPTPGTARPYYPPSASHIKAAYARCMKEQGVPSGGVAFHIGFYPVIAAAEEKARKEDCNGHPILVSRNLRGLPRGRKLLNLSYTRPPVLLQEVEAAIRDFWPQKKVAAYLEGKPVPLKSIREFFTHSRRAAHAASRTHGSLQRIMETVYPGLYEVLSRKVAAERIDEEKLAHRLAEQFYKGGTLNREELIKSPDAVERRLACQVLALARQAKRKTPSASYTGTIQRLTKFRPSDIRVTKENKDHYAALAEAFTELVLQWAPLVGVHIPSIGSGFPSRAYADTQFTYNGGEHGRADFRVGNQALEVKTGIHSLGTRVLEDIVAKYANGSEWDSGGNLERSLVIAHQSEQHSRALTRKLSKKGVNVMDSTVFAKYLARVIQGIEEKYKSLLTHLKPRMPQLGDVTALYAQMVTTPHVLLRGGNTQRLAWSKEVIQSLCALGKEVGEGNTALQSVPASKQVSLEDLAQGESVLYKGGSFLRVERTLAQINGGNVGEYIHHHADKLASLLHTLPSKSTEWRGITPSLDQILFFDIETTGHAYQDLVFMISYLTCPSDRVSKDSIHLTSLVARNPGEERPMLAYFLEQLGKYSSYCSYNGQAFDVPRINARLQHNGLVVNGDLNRTLTQKLGPAHFDLYRILGAKRHLPDAQLQTVEGLVFDTTRVGDIKGENIPPIYQKYVNGGDPTKMNKIIDHNMKDTLPLVGILTYLGTGVKPNLS